MPIHQNDAIPVSSAHLKTGGNPPGRKYHITDTLT